LFTSNHGPCSALLTFKTSVYMHLAESKHNFQTKIVKPKSWCFFVGNKLRGRYLFLLVNNRIENINSFLTLLCHSKASSRLSSRSRHGGPCQSLHNNVHYLELCQKVLFIFPHRESFYHRTSWMKVWKDTIWVVSSTVESRVLPVEKVIADDY
jgi:hypothetical protein